MLKSFFAIIICLWAINIEAQTGLINYDFSSGNTYNWGAATANSTVSIVNGKLVITLALQGSGKYRGDLKQFSSTTVHAGQYPIFAVKFRKPPHANIFFDTNLGSYNNSNNNQLVMKTADDSRVFYWDMSARPFGTSNWLSTTTSTNLSFITIKIADVVPTSEQVTTGLYTYDVDWIKTFPSVQALRAAIQPKFPTIVAPTITTFKHPGALHNAQDIARMKNYINTQFGLPYQCYLNFAASSTASSSYTMFGPYVSLTRDASQSILNTRTGLSESGSSVKPRTERDCQAAYYNALMWHLTGTAAHGDKAIEILNGYTRSLTSIVGADAKLNGLQGFMFANAAELMRSYSAWSQPQQDSCKAMFKAVFYPVLQDFVPCSHSNWDLCAMKCLMAIAIFADDAAMYNRVTDYFYNGEGNGSLYNHIVSPDGQLQESSRDQGHSQGSIGWRADICEMAWKQGLDLYAANNNALLKGYEYTASYNLGNTVPFVQHLDYCLTLQPTGELATISSIGRGSFSIMYEIAYNHYFYRKGLSMPYTYTHLKDLNVTGGELANNVNSFADYEGFGSFLFYLGDSVVHKNIVTQTDLSLSQTVNNAAPMRGSNIAFTIKVKNQGLTDATGVTVHDTLPIGMSFVSASPNGAYDANTKLWTIGNLAAGDSTTLILTARVDSVGVLYNTAEIHAMNQTDSDSSPNNNSAIEDDIDGVCVSVPIPICTSQSQTLTLTIPSGLSNIKWYRNSAEISGQTSNTLIVSQIGDYTFTADEVSCPVEGCCPVQVIEGNCPSVCKPVICLPVTVVRN